MYSPTVNEKIFFFLIYICLTLVLYIEMDLPGLKMRKIQLQITTHDTLSFLLNE